MRVRTILTGAVPWQPSQLVAAHPFVAFDLAAPDASQRRVIWEQAAPGTPSNVLDELAARFPVNGTEAHGRRHGCDGAADEPCQVGGIAGRFQEAGAG